MYLRCNVQIRELSKLPVEADAIYSMGEVKMRQRSSRDVFYMTLDRLNDIPRNKMTSLKNILMPMYVDDRNDPIYVCRAEIIKEGVFIKNITEAISGHDDDWFNNGGISEWRVDSYRDILRILPMDIMYDIAGWEIEEIFSGRNDLMFRLIMSKRATSVEV